MPRPVEWNELRMQGSVPLPRIGHTITRLDRNFILFGGLELEKDRIGPSSSVYMIKVAEKAATWSQTSPLGEAPAARCHHAACDIGKSQLLVFGGFGVNNSRLNDYHILKSNPTSLAWSQPASYRRVKDLRDVAEALPEPRANHSLTYVREANKAFLFGGHGGQGYSRKSFNDLYQFDCDTLEWGRLEPKGSPPEPRGGHVAGELPGGARFFVHGGWSSVSQFSKMFVYDVERNAWSEVNAGFDVPRWNHSALVVPALPRPKLFIFGGSTGFFEEGAPRNFGALTNSVLYFDIVENLDNVKLRRLTPEGEAAPRPRENAVMLYDQLEHRLLVHGGWSNSFSADLHQLCVDSITGPEFAIYGIEPQLGPVTGGTKCRIKGEGFKPSVTLWARFSSGKFTADAQTIFVSETELTCESPAVEGHPPQPKECEVRLYASRDDLTIASTNFNFFLNTKAERTLAFGPGLGSDNSTAGPTEFFIQARSYNNENRRSGADHFVVKIKPFKVASVPEIDPHKEVDPEKTAPAPVENAEEDPETLVPYQIKDLESGQYEVTFQAPEEGQYEIEIFYVNESKMLELVKGAPFIASFSHSAPIENNRLEGPATKKLLHEKLTHIEEFINSSRKEIDVKGTRGNIERFDLLRIKEQIQKINQQKDNMMLDLEVTQQTLATLSDPGRAREQELSKTLIRNLNSLQKDSEEVQMKIKEDVAVQSSNCLQEIEKFEEELNRFLRELKQQNIYSYATGVEGAFETLAKLDEEIKEFSKRLDDFDYFARMFEFTDKPAGCHKHMEAILTDTDVMRKLWTQIKKIIEVFNKYLKTPWSEVTPTEMQEEVKLLNKGLAVKGLDRRMNVYSSIAAEIKNWNLFLPIVEELKKDAMIVADDRHWKKFKNIIQKEFQLSPSLPLGTLWGFEIYSVKYKEHIEELTEQATQERKIEKDLEKIKNKWDQVDFEQQPLQLKEVNIKILKVPDEHLETLDEHQLLIQSIASNKYLMHYEKEVVGWQKGLSTVNETIRMLSEVQKTWSFLISLFLFSEEVKKDLREESKEFVEIDRKVKEILELGYRQKNVFEFSKSEIGNKTIIHILEDISRDLNKCQKGLNEFISKKRKIFPRFYFLTMIELLDILANGNNPLMLFKEKNYMNKIVQCGDKLEMKVENDNDRPRIISMSSAVGVELLTFVNNGIRLEGKVENYLQDVLDIIRKTIMVKCDEYVNMLGKVTRFAAIDSNYAQLNLLVNSIDWVHNVEDTLRQLQNGDKGAMKKFFELSQHKLHELIELVQGKLEKAQRQKVMCLITIDTHNRDVVEKLINENVTRAEEFHWQSQLRFYWNTEKKDAQARIADASFWYDYEYLGNGPRLVITPLTDRIYVTATQALHLKMGCAPAGPAGTGKTETTKDLASALGKACYVFNCSPEMNFETMGNIFKGLAASGCWGCFDEFNRLVPEVLSVCSVQFKAVTDSIKMNKTTVHIEDDTVHLNPTCGAFITMNPGYLGRSELPEGLKALFRPITVVVPDLELICENILMAEGFIHAKELACKFVTLYKLCKSLLSPQDHYDWGLRAIKSVLVVAGSFKRAEPTIAEHSLLFRALRDFNYPKIAEVDLQIFNGLLEDLFPKTKIERKVNVKFEEIIKSVSEEEKLTVHPSFVLKVVQLDELLEIRHSIFLMGPPGSGKSTTWKILAKANDRDGRRTTCQDLDPKVVSTRDLYGYTNLNTKEWKNGLLSHYIQHFSEVTTDGAPKWIILDGDLDANWIESMNSVMDDNKLLTLANNGRIVLKNYMRLLFEIRDLKHATPATVSRAGILYISDDSGYQRSCYVASWLNSLRDKFKINPDSLIKIFDKYFEKGISYLQKHCKPLIPVSYLSVTVSLCKMLESIIRKEMPNLQVFVNEKPTDNLDAIKLEYLFNMCAVWALGGALAEKEKRDYRKDFSTFWKNEFKGVKFPGKGTVFDYYVSMVDGKVSFEEWKSRIDNVEYEPGTAMQNITVPIPETVSIQQLSKYLITIGAPVLFIGGAGCGKTQLIKGLLKDIRTSMPDLYYYTTINFNYYTDSTYLQNMMENELVKQGNRFGPKKGGKIKLIYFIDDLNMPSLDTYNTQTAIALLRQHVDYSHWFDISKQVPMLKEVMNTQVVASMNPTSGSFVVNPRYQRHFWTVAVNNPDQNSQLMIYETFLKGHFKRFKPAIQEMIVPLIKAAIALHDRVQSSFRKTAVNFHYEFTIRHLSAIFQGILLSQPLQFAEQEKMVKLWIHESERIYSDRLVSPEHVATYKNAAFEIVKKNFSKFNFQKFFSAQNPENIMFVNFPNGFRNEKYYDSSAFADVEKNIYEALKDYNENAVEMNLVLFDDALRHVSRICRIVSSSGGHALLVGVGGSGKQSLTRLAAYICDLTPFSITVSAQYGLNNLKEDLIELYKKTGLKDEGIMFLITDSHITNEQFLVYINDLLSSGEVSDLFNEDDKMAIITALRPKVKGEGKPDTPDDCWAYYIDRVRQNLHLTLCFSPVGDTFRTRARRFPGLVNCTVIDWFQPWPKAALRNVAQQFLTNVELGDEHVRKAVVDYMPFSFEVANTVAKKCYQSERRHVYSTPKSFLELLDLFKIMLEKKRSILESEKEIYELGLMKLEETEEKVAELQISLTDIQVEVDKKKSEADQVAEVVGREKAKVEEESMKAKIEENECMSIKEQVEIQKASCEEDVRNLAPLVESAKEKLGGLNVKEIQTLKAMPAPPADVDKVFFCIMYMFSGVPGYDGDIETDKNKLPKNLDWKNGCLKLMKEPQKLIEKLKNFPNEINDGKVPAQNFAKIAPFFQHDSFKDPAKMISKSNAAGNILIFISYMVKYYDAMTLMIPKRTALLEANERLENANKKLIKVKEEVATLEASLAVLIEKYDKANFEKESALAEATRCSTKLEMAQRLVSALSSEKGRWRESIETQTKQLQLVVGDVLIASSFISYTGPFSKVFRELIIDEEFIPYVTKKGIPKSENSDPVRLLVDEATKAEWNNQGLPSDPVSIENGVILSNSERYPLMIDPQLQGITWIKAREKANNLKVLRMGAKNYTLELERAIESGTPVLFENMDENIDPVVLPVIARRTFKRHGKKLIRFSGKDFTLHPNFRLYMQTKLSNPHYPPEIQAEAALINFTVTEDGLGDQLLALVVSKERPDLASSKGELIQQQNQFKIKLKELERGLLEKLKTLEGEFLEDRELINNLENSQVLSKEIREKVEIAKVTEVKINEASELYRPAAIRGALVFFVMNELYKMSTFYIYSLESFLDVIVRALSLVENPRVDEPEPEPVAEEEQEPEKDGEKDWDKEKEKEKEKEKPKAAPITLSETRERVEKLCESITSCSFNYVRRGLFERHKIIFSTFICLRILERSGMLKPEEVKHLIMGRTLLNVPAMPEGMKNLITDAIWRDCKALEYIPDLSDFCESLDQENLHWRKWFNEEKAEEVELPKKFKDISEFHKLLIIKAMRADRVSSALRLFVTHNMGTDYIEQKPFDMNEVYNESSSNTPIFFVLFPGVDPTKNVEEIGEEKGKSLQDGTIINISMGQGQEKRASIALKECAEKGNWIFLQNVHLMQSWLKIFEKELEEVCLHAHKDFRVFISSEPPPMQDMKIIPESILQKCVKVANEAPQDMKANMLRALSHFSQATFDRSSQPSEHKCILFALCYFHSVVLGRRKFGTQGWSRIYNFNDGDLTICADVLRNYLEKYPNVPYEDIRYIYGEIMYGGHITDDWDRRTNNAYLKALIKPELLQNMNLVPANHPIYRVPDPNKSQYDDYVRYLDKLPTESPLLFGMHSNTEINYLTNQCETIFKIIIDIQGGPSSASANEEDSLKDMAKKYHEMLPEQLNMLKIRDKLAEDKDIPNPYRIVCSQECERMNALLSDISASLEELMLGLDGSLNMTDAMETLASALKLNRVPAGWGAYYASRKPLSAWYSDLKDRCTQLHEWSKDMELPRSLCLSYLFNPMSFLTAILQKTARGQSLPLDKMALETVITNFREPAEILAPPTAGAYVHGLFLEGGAWEFGENNGYLTDQKPKELHPKLPVINVIAIESSQKSRVGKYQCPVYYTTQRGPTYVFTADLKLESVESEENKWILAGVAGILNEDY